MNVFPIALNPPFLPFYARDILCAFVHAILGVLTCGGGVNTQLHISKPIDYDPRGLLRQPRWAISVVSISF